MSRRRVGCLKSETEGCVTNAKARGGGHGLLRNSSVRISQVASDYEESVNAARAAKKNPIRRDWQLDGNKSLHERGRGEPRSYRGRNDRLIRVTTLSQARFSLRGY